MSADNEGERHLILGAVWGASTCVGLPRSAIRPSKNARISSDSDDATRLLICGFRRRRQSGGLSRPDRPNSAWSPWLSEHKEESIFPVDFGRKKGPALSSPEFGPCPARSRLIPHCLRPDSNRKANERLTTAKYRVLRGGRAGDALRDAEHFTDVRGCSLSNPPFRTTL